MGHEGRLAELGADHSDGKGRFSIYLGGSAPKEGSYYAKVNQAKLGGHNQKTRLEKACLARTSSSVKPGN
jgi:hypothetical protein